MCAGKEERDEEGGMAEEGPNSQDGEVEQVPWQKRDDPPCAVIQCDKCHERQAEWRLNVDGHPPNSCIEI